MFICLERVVNSSLNLMKGLVSVRASFVSHKRQYKSDSLMNNIHLFKHDDR